MEIGFRLTKDDWNQACVKVLYTCIDKACIAVHCPFLRSTSKRLKPVEVWSPRYVFPFALIFSKRHRCKYNSEKLYCYHQDLNPKSFGLCDQCSTEWDKGVPSSRVTIKWLFHKNACNMSIVWTLPTVPSYLRIVSHALSQDWGIT